MNRKSLTLLCLLLVLSGSLLCSQSSLAGETVTANPEVASLEQFWLALFGAPFEEPFATMERTLLTKAVPDECYNGIGMPYDPDPACSPYLPGHPKVNEGYPFGLAKAGDELWVGTVTNMPCLVLSQVLGLVPPHETTSWVCEMELSDYRNTFQAATGQELPSILGDWRPPHVYRYDVRTGVRTDMTPYQDLLLMNTLGLRAAGAFDDVVLLAGPTLQGWAGGPGIAVFAYHVDGHYLGSTVLPEYNDIRKWIVAGDALYTAVSNTADSGGTVLRWRGNAADPFQFEVVGHLDAEGANLALHEGRLFVTTWPDISAIADPAGPGLPPVQAGLWMSPVLPKEGLTAADSVEWEKVWEVSNYEPDLITAYTYMGGGLASFDGYLYWGTMHFPVLSAAMYLVSGTIEPDAEVVAGALLGTHRPTNIFRGRNFGTDTEEQEVLYGFSHMPAYDPGSGQWQIVPNNMGPPRLGPAGFGNFFNTYTWTMAVYENQLYVGTFDYSYILTEAPDILLTLLGIELPDLDLVLPLPNYGADLWRFPSANSWAFPESMAGAGNYTSYGIRTMLSDDALYLGMANPMNLLTDPGDGVPEGGWELLQLTPEGPGATTWTNQVRLPVAFELLAPCAAQGTGELIHLEGTLHGLVHVTINPKGKILVNFHANSQELVGVGLVTDDLYEASGTGNLVAHPDRLPFALTGVANLQLVNLTDNSVLDAHANVHLAVNGLDEITATVVNMWLTCP